MDQGRVEVGRNVPNEQIDAKSQRESDGASALVFVASLAYCGEWYFHAGNAYKLSPLSQLFERASLL